MNSLVRAFRPKVKQSQGFLYLTENYESDGYRPRKLPSVPTPDSPDSKRDVEYIPPEEMAEMMKVLVRNLKGVGREALYRETLKQFGHSKLAGREKIMNRALKIVLNDVGFRQEDDHISVWDSPT